MKKRGQLFAEFFLVVLGVLVALMVDTWIEDRRDHDLSDEYVARLSVDIQADVVLMRERISFFTKVRAFGVRTLSWLEGTAPADQPTLLAAYYAAEIWPFESQNDTYEDMQSTGNIRLLENIDLRVRLSAHNAGIARRQDGWDLPEDYRALVRGIITPDTQEAIRKHCPSLGVNETLSKNLGDCDLPGIDTGSIEVAMSSLRSSPEAKRYLAYRVSEVDVAIDLFETSIRDAEQILLELQLD